MVALSKEATKNLYADAHKETSVHGLYLVFVDMSFRVISWVSVGVQPLQTSPCQLVKFGSAATLLKISLISKSEAAH